MRDSLGSAYPGGTTITYGEALNAIGLWLTRNERKRDRDDAALKVVLGAVVATQTYVAGQERGETPDHTAEAQLAGKWVEAAVAIRHTDPELASRLQDKAEYWTDPRSWSRDEAATNGIALDRIAAEARRLLGSG